MRMKPKTGSFTWFKKNNNKRVLSFVDLWDDYVIILNIRISNRTFKLQGRPLRGRFLSDNHLDIYTFKLYEYNVARRFCDQTFHDEKTRVHSCLKSQWHEVCWIGTTSTKKRS